MFISSANMFFLHSSRIDLHESGRTNFYLSNTGL